MSPARVYILLATYEGATYLPELLSSIRSQSFADWTLLVRDDASSDTTREIVHAAAAEDQRIVIADDDGIRRGAVGNFAWLLEQAWRNGAGYAFPADQDDIWQPDKVARQIEALQHGEANAGRDTPRLVYCDAVVVNATRRPQHASFLRQNRLPFGSGGRLETLLGRSFVLGCACAVNRALLELALPLPEAAVSHDWWLALCAASAGQITFLDAPLLEYRRHAVNASQSAVWNVLRCRPGAWKQRWEIGWRSFLQSLEQAKALRSRLRERGVAGGKQAELLDAFCRIVDQPSRWRRVWDLHRLGVPVLDWPRRALFDLCLMRL